MGSLEDHFQLAVGLEKTSYHDNSQAPVWIVEAQNIFGVDFYAKKDFNSIKWLDLQ